MNLSQLIKTTSTQCYFKQGSTKMTYYLNETDEGYYELGSFVSYGCAGLDLEVPERFYKIVERAMWREVKVINDNIKSYRHERH